MFLFSLSGEDITDYGLHLTFISTFVTLVLGILSIIFSRKIKKESGFSKGALILLILGVIAALGVFIEFLPARVIETGDTGITNNFEPVTLTVTLFFIDPYLIIMGAIIQLLEVPPEIMVEVKSKSN